MRSVNSNKIKRIFSEFVLNEENGFNERLKAAEFLMKYFFAKNETEEGGGVTIIDDIGK